MISDSDRSKFLRIIKELKPIRVKLFTQQEISDFLGVSKKKLSDFENGKNFDFWLLRQYSSILGRKVMFELF